MLNFESCLFNRVSRSANSAAHEPGQWETKTMYSGWVEPAQFPPTLDSAPVADSCNNRLCAI